MPANIIKGRKIFEAIMTNYSTVTVTLLMIGGVY